MQPHQRINHFPGSTEITRKDRLALNIRRAQDRFGKREFNFVPDTFILPDMKIDFQEASSQRKTLWIVKPCAASQGKGIFISGNPEEVISYQSDSTLPCVVSQYVMNPLLINGYKFDLRVYVLVTSFDPLLTLYVYNEGLVRFAT